MCHAAPVSTCLSSLPHSWKTISHLLLSLETSVTFLPYLVSQLINSVFHFTQNGSHQSVFESQHRISLPSCRDSAFHLVPRGSYSVVLLGQPLHLRTGFHPLICSRELLSTIFFLFTLDHQFFPVCGLISCWNFSFKNSVLKKKKKILSWPHTLAPSYHPVSLTLMIAELLTRVPSLSLILLFTFSLEPTPIRILHPTPLWNLHSTKSSGHLSCLMSLEFSAASRRVDEALFYEALSLLPGLLTADFLPS